MTLSKDIATDAFPIAAWIGAGGAADHTFAVNGTETGVPVDTAGFESCTVCLIGVMATSDVPVVIEESDDDGSGQPDGIWTAVPDELISPGPRTLELSEQRVSIGVMSKKRFIRVSITAFMGDFVDAIALMMDPKRTPPFTGIP